MKNLTLNFIEDGLAEEQMEGLVGGAIGCPKLKNCGDFSSGGQCDVLEQCQGKFTSIIRPGGGVTSTDSPIIE